MNNRFLHAYSMEEYEDILDVIDHAEAHYPFSIYNTIRNYEDCLEKKDYAGAQRCIFDLFEVSAQFLSGLLISLLVHHDVVFDAAMKEVLEKIVEKPAAAGEWINHIFFVLLPKAKMHLPGNRLVEHLNVVLPLHDNVFLGKNKGGKTERSIVSYRNEWGHGSYQAPELVKQEIAGIEPRLWRLLEVLRPLEDYRFFRAQHLIDTDNDLKMYNVVPDPARADAYIRLGSDLLLEENAYYVTFQKLRNKTNIDSKAIIKLSPFVIYHHFDASPDADKYQYVFQSLRQQNLNKMIFVSAHKNAGRLETELFRSSFRSLLDRVFGNQLSQNEFLVSFNREKSIGEYEERAKVQSKDFITQQTNSLKYDPEVFLPREYLERSFEDFLQSDCIAYILLGNAGSGKTNQICHWASATRPHYINLAFYSKNFQQVSLEKWLLRAFGERENGKLGQLLDNLERTLDREDKYLCIYFDAINECYTYPGGRQGNGPIDLLSAIDVLLVRKQLMRVKVVISCRSYTWDELLSNKDTLNPDRYYTVGEQEYVTLSGFSEAEFVEVYPRYATQYRLKTTLWRLEEDRYHFTRIRLYDPLILKMAAQNFKDGHLPADSRQFNATKVFSQRIELLERGEHGKQELRLLEDFTALLWEKYADAIALNVLYRSFDDQDHPYHKFASAVFKDESLTFGNELTALLGEGILRIDKGSRSEMRFVYERFNEFMFARHFLQQQHALSPGRKLPVPAAAYEAVLKKAGHSAVIIASLRNALILDFYEKDKDSWAIIQLTQSHLYEAQTLVEETLTVLIEECYHDVFTILYRMLEYRKAESMDWESERETIDKMLNREKKRNRLSAQKIAEMEERRQWLSGMMAQVLRVRGTAISLVYKIFKSEQVALWIKDIEVDPNKLLWLAMGDPLPEVRDNASTYIYYISRFDTDMAFRIINALSDHIMTVPLLGVLRSSTRKELQQSYIEPACRVGLFLAIDGLLERRDYPMALEIRDTWQKVVRRFTLNHVLIKLAWPFFRLLMSRQTVVQKDYVNNGVEYAHFWDTIPKSANGDQWSQAGYSAMIAYLDPATEGFESKRDLFINGYKSGDSFSLFLLERVLIVQGLLNWDNISGIANTLSTLSELAPGKAYVEMSLIYAIYQINLKSTEPIAAAEKFLSGLVEKWQLRNKGFYYAHYNDKANAGKPYKQYVLSWYAIAYCRHYGDGGIKPGDTGSAQLIRKTLTEAFCKKDKALLYNCIENIAMLAASSGYYKTSLQLFEYLIGLFKHESDIYEFDSIRLEGKLYEKGLRSFLCDMLGTVKSYFPKEVDYFVVNKLKASSFPGLDTLRDEIFNHSLSHENIGDLLTHKFGNFVIWGIINDLDIRKFFMQICSFGPHGNEYLDWFESSIRYCFQEVLGVKNFAA